MDETILIIPAYQPDQKMLYLLKELKEQTNFQLIIVNDGSSEKYATIFSKAKDYGKILFHSANQGKGAAIKTALKYIHNHYTPNHIITIADADGQHKVTDILANSKAASTHKGQLIIGVRDFKNKVPLRSLLGNRITSFTFFIISGFKLSDTQTGLRSFSGDMISFLLTIEGSRYEYEMNVLLACTKAHIPIKEIPIDTIYLNHNETSHFRPLKDSASIYKNLLQFSLSSLASFFIDLILFTILSTKLPIAYSNILARIFSGFTNFHLNKNFVFEKKGSLPQAALRYLGLALSILTLNTLVVTLLVNVFLLTPLIAKIWTETCLFLLSYTIQKIIVFPQRTKGGTL